MKLLKRASFLFLLCLVLCFMGSEQQTHSHHVSGNFHAIVHVGNSAHAGANYSSATVAPSINAVEFGSDGDKFDCSATVQVDDNPEKVSNENGEPYLYAKIINTGRTHTLTITLQPNQMEVEIAGIKIKRPSTVNATVSYTTTWTTQKLKLKPNFGKLKDFNFHWVYSSGDTYTARAEGNAQGPANSDNDGCTATVTLKSGFLGIGYGYAKCSGDNDVTR